MSDLPESTELAAVNADAVVQETKVEQKQDAPQTLQEQTPSDNNGLPTESNPVVTEAESKLTTEPDASITEPVSATSGLGPTSGDPAQLDPSLSALGEQHSKAEAPSDPLQQPSTALDGLTEKVTPNGASEYKERGRSQSIAESVKSGGSSSSGLPDNVPRVGGVRCCKP
jgi:hypothetical protein